MTNEPEQSARALSSVLAHDSSNRTGARKRPITSRDKQWSARCVRAIPLCGDMAKKGSRRKVAIPAARRTIIIRAKSTMETPLQLFLRTLYHDFDTLVDVEGRHRNRVTLRPEATGPQDTVPAQRA